MQGGLHMLAISFDREEESLTYLFKSDLATPIG